MRALQVYPAKIMKMSALNRRHTNADSSKLTTRFIRALTQGANHMRYRVRVERKPSAQQAQAAISEEAYHANETQKQPCVGTGIM